jgi:predicted acetyltransferase
MEIRKLKPEEHIHFSGICQTVFFDIERKDIREMAKKPLEHEEKDSIVRLGVFDEKGKLQSAVRVIPFTMRMNGHNVKMGGLGAVVTRPEARGKGQMNLLMAEAFREMRESGQIFSFLYPFSFRYYRKFGFEMCYAYDKVKIPVKELREYICRVNAAPFEPGDSIVPYEKIYKYFTRERNLSIVRDKEDWTQILERDPYQDLEFTYLFHDAAGRAVAYILYDAEQDDDDGNRLIIKECCWITPEAFHMVLGFLAKLGAEFEYVLWNAPSDINICTLFPEGFDLEWKRESAGMNRIVDVAAALSVLKAPERSGRVAIGVTDNFLTENTGTYAVEWENGAITVEKIGDVGPMPDIETSVETLSQLVTGYITPEAAMYKKDTAVLGSLAGLNKLFQYRNLYIMERY